MRRMAIIGAALAAGVGLGLNGGASFPIMPRSAPGPSTFKAERKAPRWKRRDTKRTVSAAEARRKRKAQRQARKAERRGRK